MQEDLPCFTFSNSFSTRKGFGSNPNLSLNFTKLCHGENVCHLLICLYVLQPNGSSLNTISQEVVPNVYVFAPVMEH